MKQVRSCILEWIIIYLTITTSRAIGEPSMRSPFSNNENLFVEKEKIKTVSKLFNLIIDSSIKREANSTEDISSKINNPTQSDYSYYIVNSLLNNPNFTSKSGQSDETVPSNSLELSDYSNGEFFKFGNESNDSNALSDYFQGTNTLIVLSSSKENISNINFNDSNNLSVIWNDPSMSNKRTNDTKAPELTNQISQAVLDEFTLIPFIKFNFSTTELLSLSDFNESIEDMSKNLTSRTGTGFSPVLFPDWVIWAWTVVLVCLLVAGLIGNSLVVAVVARTRDLRSSTNLLLVNLAGADILVLLVPLPTALTELHTKPETWVLGRAMCKAVPFVEWTVSHASVLTILVISLERYYAICRPLRASYTCTRIRALTCIVLIWIAAVLISLPIFFLSQFAFVRYKGETVLVPSCFTDMSSWWGRGYYTGMVGLLFFLPLTLLMVLYLLIGRRLMRDSTSAGNFQIRKPEPPNMRARKQVVVMIATVTVFFFVCLLPFRVFSLYIIWDEDSGKSIGPVQFYSLLYASRILLYLNSSINPILYSLTSSKFRDAFIKIVNREPPGSRSLSRHSTFTTTGNSTSNGRSGSNIFDPFVGTPNGSLRVLNLAKYGRQWSLDTIPSSARKNLSQYGRQSSFTTPTICGWNNGKACSQIHGHPESKGVFVVKEEKNKFVTTFQDGKLPCVEEHSFLGETTVLDIKDKQILGDIEEDSVAVPLQ